MEEYYDRRNQSIDQDQRNRSAPPAAGQRTAAANQGSLREQRKQGNKSTDPFAGLDPATDEPGAKVFAKIAILAKQGYLAIHQLLGAIRSAFYDGRSDTALLFRCRTAR